MKAEIARQQKLYQDEGQFADPASWPKDGPDGPFNDKKPLGSKTVAEAMAAAAGL